MATIDEMITAGEQILLGEETPVQRDMAWMWALILAEKAQTFELGPTRGELYRMSDRLMKVGDRPPWVSAAIVALQPGEQDPVNLVWRLRTEYRVAEAMSV